MPTKNSTQFATSNLDAELNDWKARGTERDINGHSIFIIDEGEHSLPVIFMIHGFPTSSWDFQGIWAELAKSYRLIAFDMLGFGFSDKPNERSYTIHQQADFAEAILKELNIGEFHLLAHDYGDTVAQELLARQLDGSAPTPCLSVCLLNGGLFPETHRALLIQKLLLSRFGWMFNALTGFKQFSQSFSKVFGEETKPTQHELEQFWQLVNYKEGKHLFFNLITYMRDRKLHRTRWVEALQKSKLPIALINGSVDPVSGSHLVTRYKELKCRLDYLAELPTIGHYPQVEDPVAIQSHYLKFLATL
jgi:pimeloyl-ACP methyl ester carboxylesterase